MIDDEINKGIENEDDMKMNENEILQQTINQFALTINNIKDASGL